MKLEYRSGSAMIISRWMRRESKRLDVANKAVDERLPTLADSIFGSAARESTGSDLAVTNRSTEKGAGVSTAASGVEAFLTVRDESE